MTPKREGFELVHIERLLSHSGGNSSEYMAPIGALLVREGNNFYVFVPSKKEWNGSGLPPVGTVCERNIARAAWCRTTILAVTPEGRNVAYQDAAGQLGWSGCESSFRPIRTPEQIAADERLHAVRNALTTIKASRSFPGDVARQNVMVATVEAMIGAGYRKVEVKP